METFSLFALVVAVTLVTGQDPCDIPGTKLYGPRFHMEYYEDNSNLKSKEIAFSGINHQIYSDSILSDTYTCLSVSAAASNVIFFIVGQADENSPDTYSNHFCIEIIDMSPSHESPLVLLYRSGDITDTYVEGTTQPSDCSDFFGRTRTAGGVTYGKFYWDEFLILARVKDDGSLVGTDEAGRLCPDTFKEAYKRNVLNDDPNILLSEYYQVQYDAGSGEQCSAAPNSKVLVEGPAVTVTSCTDTVSNYDLPVRNTPMQCLRNAEATALRFEYDNVVIFTIQEANINYYACGRYSKIEDDTENCIFLSIDLSNKLRPTCKNTLDATDSTTAENNLVDSKTAKEPATDSDPRFISFKMCSQDCSDARCQNVANCTQSLGRFSCAPCPTGYDGNLCHNNINDCLDNNGNNVCLNGGDCTDGVDSFSCRCNPTVGTLTTDGTGWRNGDEGRCEVETCYIPDDMRTNPWFYNYDGAVSLANIKTLTFSSIDTIAIQDGKTYSCEKDTILNGKWVGTSLDAATTDKRVCMEAIYINLQDENAAAGVGGTSSTDKIILWRQNPEPAGSESTPLDPSSCIFDVDLPYNILMPNSPSYAQAVPFTAGAKYHVDWSQGGAAENCVGETSNGEVINNLIKFTNACNKPATVTATNPIAGDLIIGYYWPSDLMKDPNHIANGGAVLVSYTVEGDDRPTLACGRYKESGITVDISFVIGNQLIPLCYINGNAELASDNPSTFHIRLTSNVCEQDTPCMHGGTCADNTNQGYKCTCAPGYTGVNCQTNINECDPDPCFDEGTSSCNDLVDGYQCNCNGGWTHPATGSPHCQDKDYCYNELDPTVNICQHGGTCMETGEGYGSGYRCTCVPGYTGTNCEIDINECLSTPCQNEGECFTNDNGEFRIDFYRCVCPVGFMGVNCENQEDNCAVDPCVHGHCINYPGRTPGFYCDCTCTEPGATCSGDDTHYLGVNCQHLNECKRFPDYCKNDAECVDRIPGETECRCTAGWTGKQCETRVESACFPNPCLRGGVCSVDPDDEDKAVCTCDERSSGLRCEIALLTCSDDPELCQNGGTCTTWTNGTIGYTCSCPNNYGGENCEEDTRPLFDDIGIALIACLCVLFGCVCVIVLFYFCAQSSSAKGQTICC